MSRSKFGRSSKGNVLILLVTVMILICVVVLIALAFNSLYHVEANVRTVAEKLGLEMAIKLNHGDRVGEMNSMTAASRELVYSARQTYYTISSGQDHLEPLARLLLMEARQGAQMVEGEQAYLGESMCKELVKFRNIRTSAMKNQKLRQLPCFDLTQKGVNKLEIGYIKDVPSNAQCPRALDDLKAFDEERGYLFPKTDYYKANITAPLPNEDADLTFRFASLPPMVEDTAAPARLVQPGDFVPLLTINDEASHRRTKLPSLPSAIKLVTETEIKGQKFSEPIASTIAATSAGSQKIEKVANPPNEN